MDGEETAKAKRARLQSIRYRFPLRGVGAASGSATPTPTGRYAPSTVTSRGVVQPAGGRRKVGAPSGSATGGCPVIHTNLRGSAVQPGRPCFRLEGVGAAAWSATFRKQVDHDAILRNHGLCTIHFRTLIFHIVSSLNLSLPILRVSGGSRFQYFWTLRPKVYLAKA